MTQLAFHPLANVFPLLEGEEFDALVTDIQASGLCEPVWLYEDQILDGRNRYRACQALGRDCTTRRYTGDDPLGFVISMNLRRRHLDESQRGMVAARLATMRQGERTDLVEISTKFSQEQTAALLHVSRETVVAANKVLQDGATELVQAVDTGVLAVSAAMLLTALPRDLQPAALAEVQREAAGKKATAKRTRAVVRRRQGGTTDTEESGGHRQAAEAGHAAIPKHISPLFESLEALTNLQDLDRLLRDIPSEWYNRVDQYLATAFETLRRLSALWKKHRHDAAEVPVRPKQFQHSQQPAQGQTRRKTKQSQPALIRAALHRAPQPLRLKDLREVPGVARDGLQSRLVWLVQQGQIRKTRAGYVVVSTEVSKNASGSDASHEASVAHSRDDDTIVTAMRAG